MNLVRWITIGVAIGVGFTGGWLARGRAPTPAPTAPMAPDVTPPSVAPIPISPSQVSTPSLPSGRFASRLAGLREWDRSYAAEENETWMHLRSRRGTELTRRLQGFEVVVREHLREYLDLLADPTNGDLLPDLFAVWFPCEGEFSFRTSRPSTYFPPELMVAVAKLAESGTADQRRGALGFYEGLTDFPEAAWATVQSALGDADPGVRMAALEAMNVWFPLDADTASRLRDLGAAAEFDEKGKVAGILARDPEAESEKWLLRTLEEARDENLLGRVWFAYRMKLDDAKSGRLTLDPTFYLHGVTEALRRSPSSGTWKEGLQSAVRFPGDLPLRIIDSVEGMGGDDRVNACIAAALVLMRSGETRAAVLEEKINQVYFAK